MSKKKEGKANSAGKKISMEKKPVARIVEFYYMIPKEVTAKELAGSLSSVDPERVENWLELNLMEVVMEHDSLIFQDASDCFIDPLDQEFIRTHEIVSIYEISFDTRMTDEVKRVMKELMDQYGGMICSDTETFEPIYTSKNLEAFATEGKNN